MTAYNERGGVVLLTGGEHLSVLAAVRALGAAGYRPWVTVDRPGTYAARSRFAAGSTVVPPPGADPDAFTRAIFALADDLGAVAIVPGTEVAMGILAAHKSNLPDGVALGSADPEALVTVRDKRHLADLVVGTGFSVPPTIEVSAGHLPSVMPFGYPMVIKPPQPELAGPDGMVRHHGARAAGAPTELDDAVAAIPDGNAIVQPLLPGPLGSLAGVYWDGRLVAAVQSEGDRVWPLPCGSISHARTVPLEPSLVDATTAMLRPTDWCGLFQLDFFRVDGGLCLIDFNPRLYTSLSHATRVGVDLVTIWVDLLTGRKPHIPSGYPSGVGYRNEEGDAQALLRGLVHGPRLAALRGLIPDRRSAFAVLAFDDPAPLLTSLDRALAYVRRRSPRSVAVASRSDA